MAGPGAFCVKVYMSIVIEARCPPVGRDVGVEIFVEIEVLAIFRVALNRRRRD